MPRAVTNAADVSGKIYLKSAPADGPSDEQGYVRLRRLSYGEFLQRRTMTSDMRIKGGGRKDDFEGVMQLMNEKATQFEFANCIVEHNLQDEAGNLLDFKKPSTFKMLDPRIGDEIATHIDKMNQFDPEGEEELGN